MLRAYVFAALCAACANAGKPGSGGDPVDAPDVAIDGKPAVDARPIDGTADACMTTATCAGAMNLGSISGDTGSQKVSASGYQGGWFSVRVTEDDSSVFGTKLSMTAKLTSPAASNYDVFVYFNSGNDAIECASVSASGTSTAVLDSARISWGEGSVSNGNDDGRTVSVEVRPISGGCSAGAPWALELQGDT
ncbi:MAG: hypothetical protein ABI678_26140 [Kofleriaceae bacterium]